MPHKLAPDGLQPSLLALSSASTLILLATLQSLRGTSFVSASGPLCLLCPLPTTLPSAPHLTGPLLSGFSLNVISSERSFLPNQLPCPLPTATLYHIILLFILHSTYHNLKWSYLFLLCVSLPPYQKQALRVWLVQSCGLLEPCLAHTRGFMSHCRVNEWMNVNPFWVGGMLAFYAAVTLR